MPLSISTAWEHNGEIPQRYTAAKKANDYSGAENVFPGFHVGGVPKGTGALLYLTYDAKDEDRWCHYAAVTPHNVTDLPEGASHEDLAALGVHEQQNQAGEIGWTGPYTATAGEYHSVVLAVTLTPEEVIGRVTAWTRDSMLGLFRTAGIGLEQAEVIGVYINPAAVS